MKDQIARTLKNMGFEVHLYPTALFVYLKNRHTTKMEVMDALANPEFEEYEIRSSYDAHHYGLRGVLIWVGGMTGVEK